MNKKVEDIFIRGNVPSSKNSKIWTGKILVHSKYTSKYVKNSKEQYAILKFLFVNLLKEKSPPYKISFKFYRDSRRKFDYINAAQIVQDLMVKNEWIEDDHCDIVIPVFEQYEYNKENPGVLINVL
tara:strand:- start:121 stop:498 length:378 start_codon:yes stop_codon:yes gene_type:complete